MQGLHGEAERESKAFFFWMKGNKEINLSGGGMCASEKRREYE